MPRARRLLSFKARLWRFLMQIGMRLHRLAPPIPPNPSFERVIPTAVSPTAGSVRLQFWVPKDWRSRKQAGQAKFPVVVNFHGGGFTLGAATDDARWAHTLVKRVGAVVACVDFRLAPEHPFPTAVEDGVDAVMYVARHAEELHIDINKIAVSGFSSGGNMAFTVPLRLHEELDPTVPEQKIESTNPVKAVAGAGGTTTVRSLQGLKIAAVIAWYPSADYTISRAQRRETSVNKDKELSAVFTELFDEAYIAPEGIDLSSPLLSPAVAPRHVLEILPRDIILFTCEWDMLRAEAVRLKGRLEAMGKTVVYTSIPSVPHGFDRAPNPFGIAGVKENYNAACKEISRVFDAG